MVVKTFNFLFCLLRKYQCTLVSFPLRKSEYNAIVQIMSKLQEKNLVQIMTITQNKVCLLKKMHFVQMRPIIQKIV